LDALPNKDAKVDPVTFDIILEHEFVTTEMAGVVDPARVSNRIIGQNKFRWKFYSQQGGQVASTSGAFVETKMIPDKPTADYVVFLGNQDQAYAALDVVRYIPRYSYAGSKIILLAEAAGRYIAANRGLALDHTTHWENRVLLEEEHGIFGIKSALAVTRGNITTSAGMGSTFDTMLAVMATHMSAAKFQVLAKVFLNETARRTETLQSSAGYVGKIGSATVALAVQLMHENTEEPLSIEEISKATNRSARSLERSFKVHLSSNPSLYYREIRLNLAHNLLMNTDLSNTEIALATGFKSGFSSAYKKVFGVTPHVVRKLTRNREGKIS
jgi:transcriptional regulator GlxA family with amidase domain